MSLEEAVNEYFSALRRMNYIDDFRQNRGGPIQRAFIKYLSEAPKDKIPEWKRNFLKEVDAYEERLRERTKLKLGRATGATVFIWPKKDWRLILKEDGSTVPVPADKYYLTFIWDLRSSAVPKVSSEIDSLMRSARWYLGDMDNLEFLAEKVEGDLLEIRLIDPHNYFKGTVYKLVDKNRKVKVLGTAVGEMWRRGIVKVEVSPRFLREKKDEVVSLVEQISEVARRGRMGPLERILNRKPKELENSDRKFF